MIEHSPAFRRDHLLDVARRMPRPLDLVNRAALWIAFRDPSVKQVRRDAVVPAAGS